MNDTLIIGFGNTLRGDDGAGVIAAGRIGKANPAVDCLLLQELYPETADAIAGRRRVVFIDAAVGIDAFSIEPVAAVPGPARPSSHSLTPAGLLRLSEDLSGQSTEAILARIPAFRFDFGEGLSSGAGAAVDECVARIGSLIASSSGRDRRDG
ncbi:MAG TPA: hydrogenase maturation protease [Bacteroidota bacterium]|nr:hydrogenase maturation protease [Bacteroidota bacterium]